MKKLISLLLVLTMVAAFVAGCGGKAPASNKKLEGAMVDIINQVYEKQPTGELALVTNTVDPNNEEQAWLIQPNTGLENANDIEDIAISTPMIGAIPYGLSMLRVKKGVDAKTVAEQMKAGINLSYWVCTFADDAMVAGYGDVVMLIMTSSEADFSAQQIVDAFKAVCGGELDFAMKIPYEPQGGIA